MIVNLHTHTPRCRHAEGSEREYVEVALKNDFRVLGFSDHTPYWFPGEYYTHMRMFPEQLAEYADTIRSLQKEYAGRIQLPLGVEAEYYPNFFPDLVSRLKDAGIEYMLLGQHWCGDEIGQEYNGRPTDKEERIHQFCDQVIDAMQTGLFTYIAHPDILNFVGDSKVYQKHIRRLCQEAKSCHIPLEINLLGINEGRYYPNPLFWEIAGEENCTVVIGSDAHRPMHVVHPEPEKRALEIVNKYALTLIEAPEILHI